MDEELLRIDLRILGAAGIAFLRKVHGISPVWNEELHIISGGVTLKDIEKSLGTLSRKFAMTESGLKERAIFTTSEKMNLGN